MRRVRPIITLFMLVVGVVTMASACSGDDDAVAPPATLPPGLDPCRSVTDASAAEPCLDAIEAKLLADTLASAAGEPADDGDFSAAARPIAESLLLLDVSTSFEQRPPEGDEPSTTPIQTFWRIDAAERVLWTCFGTAGVTISTEEC